MTCAPPILGFSGERIIGGWHSDYGSAKSRDDPPTNDASQGATGRQHDCRQISGRQVLTGSPFTAFLASGRVPLEDPPAPLHSQWQRPYGDRAASDAARP